MPKFTIHVSVTNNGNTAVAAHVGASLVGAVDHMEYYSTAEDITQIFGIGVTSVTRYLTSDLGRNQKYYLYVALWEAEKPIGHGIRYDTATLPNAVEKKKKKVIGMTLAVPNISPTLFFGE